MAAVSLFWDTNMAAVTSCENTLFCKALFFEKEFNSHRTGLGHQHGRRFIVLGHQYVRRFIVLGHQHGRRFIVLGHQYGHRDVM